MGAAVLMTCASLMAIDGDTVRCDDVNLRPIGDGAPYVSGFDAPEIYGRSDCPAEARLGARAMARFAELIATPGLRIEDSGELDRGGRPLVILRLPDGTTVGQTLIDEGLARPWPPAEGDEWCE